MHIVYVTGNFAETDGQILGGMQNYIYKISKLKKEKGHEVTILAIGNKDQVWTYGGIDVVSRSIQIEKHLKRIGLTNNRYYYYLFMPILREFVFNRELSKINRKKKISLVQYAGWFGVGMLYSRKYPSVLRISTYVKEQLSGNYLPEEIKLITFCECLAAKRFDGIIAPSKTLGTKYARDVKRKVSVIRTPFEWNHAEEEEDSDLYFSKLYGKKYYFFFGRISLDKGIETIAHAIPSVLKKHPDLYFVFAGPSAINNGINMLRILFHGLGKDRDRVIYLGNMNHGQLIPIIRNAQAVMLPSLMDNLPNAGLEAMNYNGILIGTRGASFDEMIRDGISGLLIDISDSHQLEERIDVVENMSEEAKINMRIHAKAELDKFSPDRTIKHLLKYYDSILKNKKKV